MNRIRIGLLIGIMALAQGCLSPPNNSIVPGHEGAPGVEAVVVLAPNTALALPAEIRNGAGVLREIVDEHVRGQGRRAEWRDLADSKRFWGDAIASAKEAGDVARAPEFLARALAEHHEFQAIVMPSIVVHQTKTNYSSSSWDSVTRRMRTINAPRRQAGRYQDLMAEGIAAGGISMNVAVTSVHVMVFSPEGERVFEGRGGLEFLHDIDLSPLHGQRGWGFSLRPDLFQEEIVREGVEIAFTPYLTPLD